MLYLYITYLGGTGQTLNCKEFYMTNKSFHIVFSDKTEREIPIKLVGYFSVQIAK